MNNAEKWQHTMQVFDEYEKRFAQARQDREWTVPTDEAAREAIIEQTKKVLAYDEKLVPVITSMEEISHQDYGTYHVTQLKYETWKNFYVSASLYIPVGEGPHPLVFIFCGHGDKGRLTASYVYMAHRLAKMGFAVMVPDNIGQGDRIHQGHWYCIAPFYSGLTVQGMIVMESVALIRYMQKDPRFDKNRFGSCGNSGAGTLNLFLAALAPELSALSSSGYPSQFDYIFEKEKQHCCCNLLPGIMHGPEMWEICSVFAPKPMLLEQGDLDNLFPNEYARRNARKIENVYVQLGAQEKFSFKLSSAGHSWVVEDRAIISRFLCEALNVPFIDVETDEDEAILKRCKECHVEIGKDTATAADAAAQLTGIRMPEGTELEDIYPPTYQGRKVLASEVLEETGRGSTMRVLAQMECALRS